MRIVKIALVNLGLCLMIAIGVVAYLGSGSHVAKWHAELSYAAYTCGKGDICFPANQASGFRDATGREHRVVFNRFGFRGRDLPERRDHPDTVRIQLYGDSMVFGTGADEGEDFAAALEQTLAARHPGQRFEVQNFGLPMNYLPSSLRAYFAYGRDFDPDVVVFMYVHTGHRDMNHRLLEIQRSPVLRAVMPYEWGKALINTWQVSTASLDGEGAREEHVRTPLRRLTGDQVERGVAVVFWEFWTSGFAGLDALVPAELAHARVSSGLSFQAYRDSEYCIAGDGHPTAAGHRFFAGRLADGLAPILAEPALRRRSDRWVAAPAPDA